MFDFKFTPGGDPPPLIVYCARCDMPCWRQQQDCLSNPFFVSVSAQCCGYTAGVRITNMELAQMRATGEHYYAIVPPGRRPGLRVRKA